MSQAVWEVARAEATSLRNEFVSSDPYSISRALGIRVSETVLPAGMSGMIVKARGSDARIYIESGDVKGRRRFTCAHELGHFVERSNIAQDEDFSFRDARGTTYDLHEFFADEFAGELLMPASKFLQAVGKGLSTTALAARFDVTANAVEKRRARLAKNPPRG